jgi:hypothetical protein
MSPWAQHGVLAQVKFEELRQALSREFADNGSAVEILMVIAALVLLVAIAWSLQRWQQRPQAPSEPFDATALFAELLVKLDMPDDQRDLLTTMAKELRLANPTTMLLSRRMFEENLLTWAAQRKRSRPIGDVLPGRIRQRLFP